MGYDEFVNWLTGSGDEWDEIRADIQGDDSTGDPVEILVSDLMGPEYKIEANSAWTVKRLKHAIQAASGIPTACQDLAAGGDVMISAEVVAMPADAVVLPASATETGAAAAERVAADAVPVVPTATPSAAETDAVK